jgi:hypothetical protein
VDTKLACNQHISNVIAKADQRAVVFFRGFISRNLAFIHKTLFCLYPSNIYIQFFSLESHKKYLIDQIENVQRRYTKRVPSLSHLSYLERLSILNLEPLEIRRLKHNQTPYYKNYAQLNIYPSPSVLSTSLAFSLTPYSIGVLQKPRNFNSHLLSSFFCRCLDCWNHLIPKAMEASTVYQFKKAFSDIDLTAYLKGSVFSNAS